MGGIVGGREVLESVEGRDGKVGSSGIREGADLVNIANGSLGGGVALDGRPKTVRDTFNEGGYL